MSKTVQLKGGTTTANNNYTGSSREVTVDTNKNTLIVHNGTTAGGNPLATESNLNSHINDAISHVTQADKDNWNTKYNIRHVIGQSSHNLSVGDVIEFVDSAYQKAENKPIGIVSNIVDSNTFEFISYGYVNILSNLTANTYYYLDINNPGQLTSDVSSAYNAVGPMVYAFSSTEGHINTCLDSSTILEGSIKSGTISIPVNSQSMSITYTDPHIDLSHSITCSLSYGLSSSIPIYSYTIYNKTVSGFSIIFSDLMVSEFKLEWQSIHHSVTNTISQNNLIMSTDGPIELDGGIL